MLSAFFFKEYDIFQFNSHGDYVISDPRFNYIYNFVRNKHQFLSKQGLHNEDIYEYYLNCGFETNFYICRYYWPITNKNYLSYIEFNEINYSNNEILSS